MISRQISIGSFPEEVVVRNQKSEDFSIIWRNLGYTVTNSWLKRGVKRLQGFQDIYLSKTILRDLNGETKSGEMVAFMGPSGAGKSTLLECIVGKRNMGRTGNVLIIGDSSNLKIAFVAQKNHFLTHLTVRETILFSAKLQTAALINGVSVQSQDCTENTVVDCSKQTDQLIADLGLEPCASNRVSNCSGGQLKRLAVAQELVVKPKVLVLDEPTTGLDSSSAQILVEFLRNLTRQAPKTAVLTTIHQPSVKILYLFDKLYFISPNGECIYEKSPMQLVEVLASHDFHCPQEYNPADFLMEIISDEDSESKVKLLVDSHRRYYDCQFEIPDKVIELSKLNFTPHATLNQIYVLCARNILVTIRDPLLFGTRLFITFATAFYLSNLMGSHIGMKGGCSPNLDADFDPSHLDMIADEAEDELKSVFNNTGNVIFVILFVMFNSLMTTCVSFPNEMIAFKAEKENLWYTTEAFYFGKIASEIPFQLFFMLCFHPLFYFLQSQANDTWRFCVTFTVLLIQQLIAQTVGYIIGSVFMYNIPAAVFLGPSIGVIPSVLLCGTFIKIKSMTLFFKVMSYFSFIRFTVEAMLITLYGYNRCGNEMERKLLEGKEAFLVWFSAMLGVYGDESDTSESLFDNNTLVESIDAPSEKFVEEMIETITGDFISDDNVVRSAVMNIYDYQDWDLYSAIISQLIQLLTLRVIAYLIIRFRVEAKR